jgi:4-hydroxy-3-polyprenylbenzoate decarboxylase
MARVWSTLSDYVRGLDAAGKLVRITIPINKDTELHPLVRLQFSGLPESERKAFLFENIVDSQGRQYDMPVLVGAMAGSADIYSLGMGCEVDEIFDRWQKALASPLAAQVVDGAPCRDGEGREPHRGSGVDTGNGHAPSHRPVAREKS